MRNLGLVACLLLLPATQASAASITFSEDTFTLGSVCPTCVTTTITLQDVENGDANVATVEMLLVGTIFQTRSGLSSGSEQPAGLIQSQHFELVFGYDLFVDVTDTTVSPFVGSLLGVEVLDTIGLLAPPSVVVDSQDFIFEFQENAQPPFDPSVGAEFAERFDWAARLLVSVDATSGQGRLGFSWGFGLVGVDCVYVNGVVDSCEFHGGFSEGPDFRVVSYTTGPAVPEPSTALLLGVGLPIIAAASRRR